MEPATLSEVRAVFTGMKLAIRHFLTHARGGDNASVLALGVDIKARADGLCRG
jgi:hypothetical protein